MRDQRMMVTMSVLLGLDISSAGEDMDTSPLERASPPPMPKETKTETKRPEAMDVDLTPEQRQVG